MNIIELAKSKGLWVCCAESLTSGRVAVEITQTPGSSAAFLGSIIAYTDASKSKLLGIDSDLIIKKTSVSKQVAKYMALGARKKFAISNSLDVSKVVAVSTTGVAGPSSVGKNEVGTVYIAIASKFGVKVIKKKFNGERDQIADQTSKAVLHLMQKELVCFF